MAGATEVSTNWELHVTEQDWQRVSDHFFPGDQQEHGGVLICGVSREPNRNRLLVREFVPATEPSDYGPTGQGTNQLSADFISEQILRCRDEELAYLALHNHGGSTSVSFSTVDLASHERGYPALAAINSPNPIGGLVLATDAVAGDLWLASGQRTDLARTVVVGGRRTELSPRPLDGPFEHEESFHRQTLMFGDQGQGQLAKATVAIVGLGGIGSLVTQLLARVGVGHLILIDPDHVEISNVSRLVDATQHDAGELPAWLPLPEIVRAWIRSRLARTKTEVAARVARRANPRIAVTQLRKDVANPSAAMALRAADIVILAADTMSARLVVNAVAQQYLIPVVQTGSKVQTEEAEIVRISSAVRPVGTRPGCLWCNELISPIELANEGLNSRNREAQRYVDDPGIAAPSVVTLNSIAAGVAANHAMMYLTGIGSPDDGWLHIEPANGLATWVEPRSDLDCTECGGTPQSRRARGDSVPLPLLAQ